MVCMPHMRTVQDIKYKIVEEYISRICISRVPVFFAYLATQYLKSMIFTSIFPLGFARN